MEDLPLWTGHMDRSLIESSVAWSSQQANSIIILAYSSNIILVSVLLVLLAYCIHWQ